MQPDERSAASTHDYDPIAALQHEIREAAHEVASLVGLANTVGIVARRPERVAALPLYLRVLEDELRVLHASLSRSEELEELRAAAKESKNVLRVREGWRYE